MPIKVKKLKPEFIDERGFITRIIDQDKYPIRSVLYITGKAGTVRGNHYHKKDAHYIYCLAGKFRYSEKDISKSNSKLESVLMEPGDLLLTKPKFFHMFEFLEESVFLAITTESREQDKYEKGTVRMKVIPNEK